jgi:hypothetical protein
VLGALALTFDTAHRRSYFPQCIVPVCIVQQPETITHYEMQSEYSVHLLATMTLAANTMNCYLQAAGSTCKFSFGSIRHFGGRPIAELICGDWATPLVVGMIEQSIMHHLAAPYNAIQQFIACTEFAPRQGYCRMVLPTFTSNSDFAMGLYESVEANELPFTMLNLNARSPRAKDLQWIRNLSSNMEEVRAEVPNESFTHKAATAPQDIRDMLPSELHPKEYYERSDLPSASFAISCVGPPMSEAPEESRVNTNSDIIENDQVPPEEPQQFQARSAPLHTTASEPIPSATTMHLAIPT